MIHKRLILSTVFLLGIGLTGLQAQNMYVKEISGTQYVHSLSNIRKMSVSEGNLTVTRTDNSSEVYALNDLRYLSFSEITSSIEELKESENQTLSMYPNPVINELFIDLTGLSTLNGTINILSPEGRVIKTQQVKGSGIVSLDLNQLPQGIYLCRYNSGTEIKTVKIIKL